MKYLTSPLLVLTLTACVLGQERITKEGQAAKPSPPIVRAEPLTLTSKTSGDQRSIVISNETVSTEYRVVTGTDAIIRPEGFKSLSGTAKGASALAGALALMLVDEPLDSVQLAATDQLPQQVDAVAVFKGEGSTLHLLTVRFEDGVTLYDWLPMMVTETCHATLPPGAGGCECSATGETATCSQGNSGPQYWAKCSDGQGSTVQVCRGAGGSCACGAERPAASD